ncbi:MAG: archaellin/type IV pilin N-terminal domain-containing protein [Fervidicoccaceae archaeon]
MGVRKKLVKRGVSPIVATLLLILIAIAAAAVLYVWVNTLSSSTTQYNPGNVASAISIDAADLSTTTLTAYVRNVGSNVISGVLNVYIYNQTGTLIATGQSGSVTIQPGQVQSISVTLSITTGNQITQGTTYTVKVVAPGGASAVASVTAHS